MLRKLLFFLLGTVALLVGVLLLSALWANGQSAAPPAAPRWAPDSASVRVAAGPQYQRGPVWHLLWGRHYRAWWATHVQAPVLRLHQAGLVPVQAGGSYQSRTLRLRDAQGDEWVLRSVDKDASGALQGWSRRLLGGLLRDQTSVALPYGALPAAALAHAADVLHANPRLVYVPADTALRQFRARFANALYWLEERPDDDQRHTPSFGRAPQVVSSARMLRSLHTQPAEGVAARAYLRVRLLDMLLGDWSRREDQWRWARFPAAGGAGTFRPIPRDRDQAFFQFDDGVLTALIAPLVPKFQSFGPRIAAGQVEPLTRTARALDRSLLAYLSEADFCAEANILRRLLTDSTLARALRTGPPELWGPTRQRLLPRLRSRRACLPAVAAQYFRVLNETPWLVGTDAAERFVLSADGPGWLRVRVLARRPAAPDSLLGEQVYRRGATRRLELYGLGGDDVFEVQGQPDPGFAVHCYGGGGANALRLPGPMPGLVWFAGPGSEEVPAAVPRRPAAVPDRTSTARQWLGNYRLDD